VFSDKVRANEKKGDEESANGRNRQGASLRARRHFPPLPRPFLLSKIAKRTHSWDRAVPASSSFTRIAIFLFVVFYRFLRFFMREFFPALCPE
jgi:hypothetical protein